MNEFVYILSNEAFPDLFKIGKTNNIEDRVRQLSSHSGVPIPFEVYYACKVADSSKVEKSLHDAFADYRLNPRREFLHVDDMASACIHVMSLDSELLKKNTHPMTSHINIGTGVDVTIKELTETIGHVVGFKGQIKWDVTKPDGTARKLLNVKLIEKLGWQSTVTLRSGLERTYDWFLNQTDYRS